MVDQTNICDVRINLLTVAFERQGAMSGAPSHLSPHQSHTIAVMIEPSLSIIDIQESSVMCRFYLC